jgi:hypothetical protein
VETAVVETTVEVETEEEDINILFNHILKRCQCKLTPFLFPHPPPSPKERELEIHSYIELS